MAMDKEVDKIQVRRVKRSLTICSVVNESVSA